MATTLENILELCAEEQNLPGMITSLSIIENCGVTATPAPDTFDSEDDTTHHAISGDLTLATGYLWKTWNFRKMDATFTFEDAGEPDGEVVNCTVNIYIPKITGLKSYITNQCRYGEYRVLIKDRNNTDPRMLGEQGNGCRLQITEQSNPKNGYVITITWQNADQKPYFYSGAVVTTAP